MNQQNEIITAAAADALQARFARRITAALTERSQSVAPDIGERLKFAREQALQRARLARPATAPAPEMVVAGFGAYAGAGGGRGAAFGSGFFGPRRTAGSGWGLRLGSVLPLIALVAGLVMIQRAETDSQISAAAEIDTALLADDVPPDAYNDPGFVEYLKGAAN